MMKTIYRLAVLAAFVLPALPTAAQCGFKSDINLEPQDDDGIYCPYDTLKMSIVEPFDSFQWYYNFDGATGNLTPIGGANGPVLEILIGDYGYAFFFVELTRGACTELSEPVVIDSWVFAPVAVQHDPQSEYCNGDSTLITNAFGAYASYQWLRDYEPIEGATGPEYWVRESGTYVLTASPFECPELILSSGIGPSFTFTGPEVPVISWDGALLTASSGPSYQWSLNGMPIPGATGQSFEPEENGVYTVTASDGSGCAPTSAPVAITISGLEGPAWAREFRIFPNPLGEALTVEPPQDAAFELQLLDAQGKEVQRQAGKGALVVDTRNLKKGIYLCQVFYRGEAATFRLAKP